MHISTTLQYDLFSEINFLCNWLPHILETIRLRGVFSSSGANFHLFVKTRRSVNQTLKGPPSFQFLQGLLNPSKFFVSIFMSCPCPCLLERKHTVPFLCVLVRYCKERSSLFLSQLLPELCDCRKKKISRTRFFLPSSFYHGSPEASSGIG